MCLEKQIWFLVRAVFCCGGGGGGGPVYQSTCVLTLSANGLFFSPPTPHPNHPSPSCEQEKGKYEVMTGQLKSGDDIVDFWAELMSRYPSIILIIDPLRKQVMAP